MFVKLAVLACVAVSALAQHWAPIPPGVPAPAQFPAGVSPHACPNYPNCGNPAVSASPNSHWNGPAAPAWNGGQQGGWNNGNNGAWNGGDRYASGQYTGDGDYHGEGLQEAGAFGDISHNQAIWGNGVDHNNGAWNGNNNGAWNGNNNGAWNGNNNGAWNGGYAPNHGAAAALPAGVDGHACPNYPFCH